MTPVVEVLNAQKAYGAVKALNDVSISVEAGEILAVLGDNGAGKSTLIKSICGVHRLDSGTIRVQGREVTLRSPTDARALGIEAVYQDLALFDNLGAAENFYAGRELAHADRLGPFALIRRKAMETETASLLRRLQVRLPDTRAHVGLMSGGQRQAIAVTRAVAFATSVIILDEPTAALGVKESRGVRDLVRRLPDEGIAVILISHDLTEVTELADRAVVLRRGELVGEAIPDPTSHDHLVSLIVGSQGEGVI
jgi:D-xylose transport system ATP-binding protein